MSPPIPVTLISGFLGSGKTTLVRDILATASRRYAVIVNDFGALDIDGDLIAEVEPNVIALKNGCICCSIGGDLSQAILRVSLRPIDEIIIEASGVSEPYAVADQLFFGRHAAKISVRLMLCLVDAASFAERDYASTETVVSQAAACDIAVLNFADLASPADLDHAERTLREAAPRLRFVRTSFSRIPEEILGNSFARARRAPRAEPDRPAEQRFSSWSWTIPEPLLLDRFKDAVAALPLSIYRAKGIMRFVDAPGEVGIFQLAGKRSQLDLVARPSAGASSRLVVIGAAQADDLRGFPRSFEDRLGLAG